MAFSRAVERVTLQSGVRRMQDIGFALASSVVAGAISWKTSRSGNGNHENWKTDRGGNGARENWKTEMGAIGQMGVTVLF